MVRCEGPCPCPTEQAATSASDSKPGNKCWVMGRQGWLTARDPGVLLQGSGRAREICNRREEVAKTRNRPEGPVELEGLVRMEQEGLASSQGACAVCFWS